MVAADYKVCPLSQLRSAKNLVFITGHLSAIDFATIMDFFSMGIDTVFVDLGRGRV